MRRFNSYGPSLIVLGTAIVILLAGPSAVWRLTYEQTRARIIQASEALDDNPILQQLSQAYRDIATLVEPSVVHISTERPMTVRLGERRYVGSSGSGWIYDEAGHVVTNYHVIQNAQRIEVQLHNGIIRAAEVVGYDQSTDIAVIKIEPGRLFPALIAKTDDNGAAAVKQGDLVFAFGSPFDFRFSMSSGVVSGIGRSVGVIRDERGVPMGYENFIQVDAAINPGNSGRPLTNARGRGIGLKNKLLAYGLQDEGLDTVEAHQRLGFKPDLREYGIGAQILRDLGVRKLRLLTNNPRKLVGLDGYGLEITDREPIEIPANVNNRAYLETKRDKLGHLILQ